MSLFLRSRGKSGSLLHRGVICDEKLIFYDNRKRSQQWVNTIIPAGHYSNNNVQYGICLVGLQLRKS